jgi:hypothetical protein
MSDSISVSFGGASSSAASASFSSSSASSQIAAPQPLPDAQQFSLKQALQFYRALTTVLDCYGWACNKSLCCSVADVLCAYSLSLLFVFSPLFRFHISFVSWIVF